MRTTECGYVYMNCTLTFIELSILYLLEWSIRSIEKYRNILHLDQRINDFLYKIYHEAYTSTEHMLRTTI